MWVSWRFPELIAAVIERQDLAQWAAVRDLVTPRGHGGPGGPGMPHAILLYMPGSPGVFLLTCENLRSAPLRQRNGEEMLACCLLVRDMETALTHLKANGVRLEADVPLDRGSCGINLRCYDPDGNKLELVQPAR